MASIASASTSGSSTQRIESSLVVAEDFVDSSNTEWRIGDRAPLARRGVREAAIHYPHRFLIEYEATPFDAEADWFQVIVADYERSYQELKAHRDSEAERREKALRVELKAQDQAQPALARRYAEQEKEREEQAKRIRGKTNGDGSKTNWNSGSTERS